MSTDLVFNDLSFVEQLAIGSLQPRDLITDLVQTLAKLVVDAGVRPTLRSSVWFDELVFATATGARYGFADWRGDRAVDRDTRAFLGRLEAKVPVEADLGAEEEEHLLAHDYEIVGFAGHAPWAASVALVCGDVLASLATADIWDTSTIFLTRTAPNGLNAPGAPDEYEVLHAAADSHVPQVAARMGERARTYIAKGAPFADWCDAAFPRLRFSPDVLERDRLLDAGWLTVAVEKLARMDESARRWQEGGAPVYLFDWSPESEATRANRAFMEARTFRLPEGERTVFERHTKISRRYRIHFVEDRVNQTFIIGYVGDHLPTVMYRH